MQFLHENLAIADNLIAGAHEADVQRLMFLGSSCICPKLAPEPIREDSLLAGPLEATNEPYAIAKITGVEQCEADDDQYGRQYVSAMSTRLRRPNDNYDLQTSHVLPALIRKTHEAKLRGDAEYLVWGSGTPTREFLYVDDLADACMHLMERSYDGPLVNIGTGQDMTRDGIALACPDFLDRFGRRKASFERLSRAPRGRFRGGTPPESVVKLTHGNLYNRPFRRHAAG